MNVILTSLFTQAWGAPRVPDFTEVTIDENAIQVTIRWDGPEPIGFTAGQAAEFEVIIDSDPQKCYIQPPGGTDSNPRLVNDSNIPDLYTDVWNFAVPSNVGIINTLTQECGNAAFFVGVVDAGLDSVLLDPFSPNSNTNLAVGTWSPETLVLGIPYHFNYPVEVSEQCGDQNVDFGTARVRMSVIPDSCELTFAGVELPDQTTEVDCPFIIGAPNFFCESDVEDVGGETWYNGICVPTQHTQLHGTFTSGGTCLDSDGDEWFAEDQGTVVGSMIGDCEDNPDYGGASMNPGETEVCDGYDNDCDDVVDEGCTCMDGDVDACGSNIGECTFGITECASGQWTICDGINPTTETCDGADNDCDGEVDEDFADVGMACDGPDTDSCDNGFVECRVDGSGTECVEFGPSIPEICDDGVDNDCDGDIDEGCGACVDGEVDVCGSDIGECISGIKECVLGQWTACDDIPPSIEVCGNGLDEDCNGADQPCNMAAQFVSASPGGTAAHPMCPGDTEQFTFIYNNTGNGTYQDSGTGVNDPSYIELRSTNSSGSVAVDSFLYDDSPSTDWIDRQRVGPPVNLNVSPGGAAEFTFNGHVDPLQSAGVVDVYFRPYAGSSFLDTSPASISIEVLNCSSGGTCPAAIGGDCETVIEFDEPQDGPHAITAGTTTYVSTSPVQTEIILAPNYFTAEVELDGAGRLHVNKTQLNVPTTNSALMAYWPNIGTGTKHVEFLCQAGDHFECTGAAATACSGVPQTLVSTTMDTNFSCGFGKNSGDSYIYYVAVEE